MFTQFIEGHVVDAPALHGQLERWREQCGEGAAGWLGTTAGVTTDGTAFIAARFESTEAARANSQRPEQSSWWAETEGLFDEEVSFFDTDDVETFRGGGSNDAGFVQVIRGQVTDVETAKSILLEEMPEDERPDILGGLVGMQPDGTYVAVVYFISEAEARAAEVAESDNEFSRTMDGIHITPPRFLDVTEPWMSSP